MQTEGESTATRDRIANEALRLFSQKGYSAASIRAIGAMAGVKESTIYYHFKNKQDIMDTLLKRVETIVSEMKKSFAEAFAAAGEISAGAMATVAEGVLMNYLMNENVYPLMMTLSIERMQAEEAQREYKRIMFELTLEHQEAVFAQMAERGFIARGDARALAEEYFGIIHLAFERFCVGCGKADTDKARAQIRRGIKLLCEREGIPE